MAEYLTPDEVASQLRVTRRTVYQWLTDGKLKALKAGRSWRIRQADIDSFLDSSFDVETVQKDITEVSQ